MKIYVRIDITNESVEGTYRDKEHAESECVGNQAVEEHELKYPPPTKDEE